MNQKKIDLDQNRMPLLDAVLQYEKRDPAYFCVPGHRFERGVSPALLDAFGERVFRCDLTETEGLDDLHCPEGVILEAQQLAAACYGADQTWFLVNGTTCGNEAMVLSACRPGEKIILPGNVHKSVYMGLVLSGAVPVWVLPEYLPEHGIFGEVLPETIEQAFRKHPDAKAALIVSPTYYGTCSRLGEIAQICHSYNAALLVDEAHGSHLGFSQQGAEAHGSHFGFSQQGAEAHGSHLGFSQQGAEADGSHLGFSGKHSVLKKENGYVTDKCLPPSALQQGADLVVQSMHKTGSSLTMSSLLHRKGNRISSETISDNLKMVMSTSPSYLLMASLDAARREMALHGREHGEYAAALGREAAARLSQIDGCSVLAGSNQDPTRLVFSLDGYSGYELKEILFQRYNLSMELSDAKNVVAVLTWGNTKEEIQRLADAAAELSAQGKTNQHRDESTEIRAYAGGAWKEGEMVIPPRVAHFAEKCSVPLADAVGKISGEMIAVYPPGIPLIYPGERLTEEAVAQLQHAADAGWHVHGPEDPKLNQVRIIAD